MKKLITALLLLSGLAAFSQTQPPNQVFNGALYQYKNSLRVDSNLFIPKRDTIPFNAALDAPGNLRWRPTDSIIYYWRGNRWISLSTPTDLSGYIPLSQKGAPNGVATLDGSTHVPTVQLGSGTTNSTTALFGNNTWGTVVKSINGQIGDASLNWQQVTDEGSNTSNVPIVARDTEGYRIQQASPGASKNNTIRYTTSLNGRELALLGYQQSISSDSTFFIINRSGNVRVDGLGGGFDVLNVNGAVVWNTGNDAAGTAVAPTLTGANVLATFTTSSTGRVTAVTTRALTAANISALPSNAGLNDVMTNDNTTTFQLNFNKAPSASNKLMDLQQSYGLFSDNAGSGSANSRIWLDGPDRGQVIIGPRAGVAAFDQIRLRGKTVIDSSLNIGDMNNPTSTLQVRGSVSFAISTVTTATTLDATHSTLIVNNAGTDNMTLPLASTCPGRKYTIKKISAAANDVGLLAAGSDTIDGGASKTLTLQYSSITVQSNGVSAWYILSSHVAASIL